MEKRINWIGRILSVAIIIVFLVFLIYQMSMNETWLNALDDFVYIVTNPLFFTTLLCSITSLVLLCLKKSIALFVLGFVQVVLGGLSLTHYYNFAIIVISLMAGYGYDHTMLFEAIAISLLLLAYLALFTINLVLGGKELNARRRQTAMSQKTSCL